MIVLRSSAFRRRAPALILAVAGAAMCPAGSASAQSIFSDAPLKGALTTLGIIAPDRAPIEYHERAPLVVPKDMDLPAPAPTSVSARNPNWPVDPDVAEKLREKAQESQPVSRPDGNSNNADRLSIWAILGGKSNEQPIQPAGPDPYPFTPRGQDSGFIPNGIVRAQGQRFAAADATDKDEIIAPGHEPKRKYLTDPPRGYRLPSAKASFKKQYGAPPPPDDKLQQNGDPYGYIKEQRDRNQGSYDRTDADQ